jgi:hypothetical protein
VGNTVGGILPLAERKASEPKGLIDRLIGDKMTEENRIPDTVVRCLLKRSIGWALVAAVLVIGAPLLVNQHYELNVDRLETQIAESIPPGSPKNAVIHFVQARHPVAFDDFGAEVKCRLTGRAFNLIYRRDVVITFEFSPDGKLVSHSLTEFQTFL